MTSPEDLSNDTEATDASDDVAKQRGPRFMLGDGEDTEGMLLMPIINELNAMDESRAPSSGSPYD